MQATRDIADRFFTSFVADAARQKALFRPESADIVLRQCRNGASRLHKRARDRFESDDDRSRWLDEEMVEARTVQIPKAVRQMVRLAKQNGHRDGRFVVIHEDDSAPTFAALCPGFWPFC